MLKYSLFSSASKSSLEITGLLKTQGLVAWAVQDKLPLVALLYYIMGLKLGLFLASKSVLNSVATDAMHCVRHSPSKLLPRHYQSFF